MTVFNDDRLKRALQVVELDKAVKRLQPHAFSDKVAQLVRGGLPFSSIPGGSRSAEKPIPKLDDTDMWIDDQTTAWSDGHRLAMEGLRAMFAAENALLEVIDRSKANEILSEEHSGQYRFECKICKEVYKRTERQRPRSGRCRACWDWWKEHGRTEDAIPPDVLARRIEMRLARQAETG